MDDEGIGVVAAAIWIVGILVVGTVLTGVGLYVTDYGLEATVQETRCSLGEVEIQTKLFSIDHTVADVPNEQCILLRPGYVVEYHVRSGHTILYDAEGRCLYDSEEGPCGVPGGGGGGGGGGGPLPIP